MFASKQRIQSCFGQAASGYDQAATLQHTVTENLISLTKKLPSAPKSVIDLGTGTGYGAQLLHAHYPEASITAIDIAYPMLKQAQKTQQLNQLIQADFDRLPLATLSADWLFSSLAIQWSPHLSHTLSEWSRVLSAQGHLFFSTLLEGSLIEVKQAFQNADLPYHAHPFYTCDGLKNEIAKYFEIMGIRLELRTLKFHSLLAALKSLKNIGAQGKSTLFKGLYGKNFLDRLQAHYPRLELQCEDHLETGIGISYHVAYVHAGKKSP